MSRDGYSLFCPIAKACEMLGPRWTMLVLGELWSGSTRFNEIRRGLPGMSPTLLSKRLREMEEVGLVARCRDEGAGETHYRTTPMADELEPIIFSLGKWAHRNINADVTLEHLDARVLMWNLRRKVDTVSLPKNRRSVVQFIFPELPRDEQSYWLLARPGAPVDLCLVDPGHDVDLFITADLKAMTAAWLGLSSLHKEIARGRIELIGDRHIASSIGNWMVRSSYAAA